MNNEWENEKNYKQTGVRGMEIEGKFVKFTAIGVYLEQDSAISALAPKWKGKTTSHLATSPEFFRDVVTGTLLTINC